jgi:hypothetical protein
MNKPTTKSKSAKQAKPGKNRLLKYLLLLVALVVLYIPFSKKVADAHVRSVSQSPLSSGSLIINKFEWHDQDAKKAMIAPRPGTHYVTVDVGLEHGIASGAWFAPAVESYIVNDAGAKRAIELVRLDDPFDARSYNAGERAVGSLSYLVGDKDSGQKWCYRFTAGKDQKDLCVPLNKYNHRSKL